MDCAEEQKRNNVEDAAAEDRMHPVMAILRCRFNYIFGGSIGEKPMLDVRKTICLLPLLENTCDFRTLQTSKTSNRCMDFVVCGEKGAPLRLRCCTPKGRSHRNQRHYSIATPSFGTACKDECHHRLCNPTRYCELLHPGEALTKCRQIKT